MLRKCFLVPAVLSLAMLGIAVDFVDAQVRVRADIRRDRRDDRRDVRRGYTTRYYYAPGWWGEASPRVSFYFAPGPDVGDSANIRVILPDPAARVWFDGAATMQTGSDRLFHTPALTAGFTASYRIRATWMEGDREVMHERDVDVMPGRNILVDFTLR